MKTTRLTAILIALALVPGAAVGGLAVTSSASPRATVGRTSQPVLVAISGRHVSGEDRIVFRFQGGLPASHGARYVSQLISDGSGKVIPVAGRGILRVRFGGATAHDASGSTAPVRTVYPLPNVMLTVQAGDFEGVVSYGLGVARRTPFHVTTLHNPARVVVHLDAGFPTALRRIWLFDRPNWVAQTPPYFVPRPRPVPTATPATGLLDRLYAGATPPERALGLSTLRSNSTGFRIRSISGGIARVQLTGGCATGGSFVNVSREIMPTLRMLPTIDWIKIYSPSGHTEHPFGHRDSIPFCLEP
jgi:hypothetical protein